MSKLYYIIFLSTISASISKINSPTSLHPRFIRSNDNEGSGSTLVFNSQLTTENDHNSLGQWHQDLTDATTSLYKQAVDQAISLINDILSRVFSNLNTQLSFINIKILRFEQATNNIRRKRRDVTTNGVTIIFEFYFAHEDVAIAIDEYNNENSDFLSETNLEEYLENWLQEAVDEYLADGNEDGLLDNAVLIQTDDILYEEICPDCWLLENGLCKPDVSKVLLTCGNQDISLSVDKCIMGNTNLDLLSLDSQSCSADSHHISEANGFYNINVRLDECSTSMEFADSKIIFANHLIGNFEESNISTVDRFNIEFQCKYDTQYDDISASTDVQSAITDGGQGGNGQLGFSLHSYTDDHFNQINEDAVTVGDVFYFGIRISSVIEGIEFSGIDCTVKSIQHDLEYKILTNKCPNTKVNFQIFDNIDSEEVRFAYKVFRFRNAAENTLHLVCSVTVCLEHLEDSTCRSVADCSKRRKRSLIDEDYQVFKISKEIRLR